MKLLIATIQILTLMFFFKPNIYAQDFSRPAGIYVLATPENPEIMNLPFVDGYVKRTGWGILETAEKQYDFSEIDALVEQLDAVDQKLTLVVFTFKVPDYILERPEVETYYSVTQNASRDTFLTAVPWDSTALGETQAGFQSFG